MYATTIIDTVTNLTELVRIASPTAAASARAFELAWLFRYPRPVRVVHDQGTEFLGLDFQFLLQQYGIADVQTSVRNPQANAVCERMHQVVGNSLRTLIQTNPPQTLQQAEDLLDYALSTTSFALRSSATRHSGISPGALVFHRDMLIDVPFVTDLLLLRDKRQAVIDYNLRRENNKRRNFDYQVGQQVLEVLYDTDKLGAKTSGPFTIDQVHTNGTITIRRQPHLQERINIRRVRPYFQ
jgi:transposase InsO family protein